MSVESMTIAAYQHEMAKREAAAFRRGAKAMQEAAIAWMLDYATHHSREDYSARERGDADAAVEHRTLVDAADMILVAIRALPLPENKQ
jgi:SAM-dependent MidA family methyltransferase